LLNDSASRNRVVELLIPQDYEDLPTAAVFKGVIELHRSGVKIDLQTLSDKVADDIVAPELLPGLFFGESLHATMESFSGEKCLYALRVAKVERRIDELNADLATAERLGDNDELEKLVMERGELDRKRRSLLPMIESSGMVI